MKLKRFMAGFLALLATQLAVVPKSHAIMGVVSGDVPMALIGIASVGLGYEAIIIANKHADADRVPHKGDRAIAIVSGVLGTVLWVGGGLLLSEDTTTVNFSPINADQAAALGVNATDMATYNSEIEEANALKNQMVSDLAALKTATPEQSAAEWASLKDLVSPATAAVMGKIAGQSFN